jgi:predicted N-acyltransferase
MTCHEESYNQAELKLSIFDSVNLLNQEHWNAIVPPNEVYLTLPYLKALESTLADRIDFRYILFYSETFQPIGVAIVQLLRFTNDDLNTDDLHDRFGHYVSEKFIHNLDARVLLCGNAFSTGENGFIFCDTVSNDMAKRNLSRALNRIKRDEKKANNGVSIILLKDFWPKSFNGMEVLEHDGFSHFEIDVNMVVKMKPNWQSFDDYLCDLVTKFRTKVKGIYKKSSALRMKPLTPEEIAQYQDRIDQLYGDVLERADYRFGNLKADTFRMFAESMPKDFRLAGYFLQDELVGFSTCFKGNEVVDANFVGIDYRYNHEYAIYQRMLCDFIQYTIDCGLQELRLGRTAEEIKSTLGAEPIHMKLYVKHKNHITNKLVKPIVGLIKPSKFGTRKPFKAVLYQQ